MKQFLLIIFISFTTLMLSAQIDINPSDMTIAGNPSDEEIVADFITGNSTQDTVSFYWEIIKSDVPEEWEIFVCDINLCYDPEFQTTPEINPVIYGPGEEHPFALHLKPNGVIYDGEIKVRMFSVEDYDVTYGELTVNHYISTSPTVDLQKSEITIFPNPTSEYFKIKHDGDVHQIAIFNLLGKRLKTYKHTTSKLYNISEFSNGLYIVRLFDDSGNSIKALRLTKK